MLRRIIITQGKLRLLFLMLLILSSCNFNGPGPLEKPDMALQLIQNQTEAPSTLFFQMSDTQFGMLTKYLSKYSLGIIPEDFIFPVERRNFEAAIKFTNTSKPDFIIICGDLVHGPIHQGQTDEFNRIAGLLDPSIPLYPVSGNHDVGSFPTPRQLKQYREVYGPDWYAFEEGNVIGIVLNSSLIRNPEGAKEEALKQQAWIEAELKRIQAENHEDKKIIVFQHHPFFKNNINEAFDGYMTIDMQQRKYYMELFSEYGVTAVMAGHLHGNAEGKFNKVNMITTSAIGIADPFKSSRTGLRVVRTGVESFQHAFIAIEDFPEPSNLVTYSEHQE